MAVGLEFHSLYFLIGIFQRNCMSKLLKCVKLTALLLFLITAVAYGGEINISGKYQGSNLYVQNPFASDRISYCTEQVFVNNELALINPEASAFEIDLSHLSLGAPISIRIVHKDGCTPMVVNPHAIASNDGFRFLTFIVEPETLKWITTNETASCHFYIERLEEDGWIEVADIPAKGRQTNNFYKLPADHIEGVNTYRIRFVQPEGDAVYSNEASLDYP